MKRGTILLTIKRGSPTDLLLAGFVASGKILPAKMMHGDDPIAYERRARVRKPEGRAPNPEGEEYEIVPEDPW